MGLSRGRIVAIGLIVLFLFGFVFLRGPTPHIAIKAETIKSFGPFDLTNTVLTSWIVVLVLIAVVYLGTRRRELVPRGFQNVFEAVLEAFYNLVVSVAGEKNGRRFFPVVATIFFFVLASNWLSLLPVFNVIGLVKEEEGPAQPHNEPREQAHDGEEASGIQEAVQLQTADDPTHDA